MRYLATAFSQLSFAWKLYNYGLEGKIDREALDIPITLQDERMVLVSYSPRICPMNGE